MQSSDPPLCPAHNGYLGHAKKVSAEASGIYDRQLSRQELADLPDLSAERTLNNELVLNRIFLRRFLAALQQSDELDAMQLAKVAPVVFRGTQVVARLLRDERALSGETADGLTGAIGQALDELSEELGLEL